MATEADSLQPGLYLSIGIFAWNEERAIVGLLNSLLQQDLFVELQQRKLSAEIVVVANGCTDATAETAERALRRHRENHPARAALRLRVENLTARGKNNAWNQYVHALSSPEARFLIMMDADILFHRQGTLSSLVRTLEQHPPANVAVDQPCKHVLFKARKSWRDRLSLAAARTTQVAEGQLCGQLYCIRSEIARNIYLPQDLAACEDGFIKALVCTDFLAHEVQPERIRLAERAEHTFEAYTSPKAILRNQKRQVIGQTIVHILIDKCLKQLSAQERARLAATLKARDEKEPGWLKQQITNHLRQVRFFWRLHPGLMAQRLKRLRKLGMAERLRCLPSAAAGSLAELLASFNAYRTLKAGCTNYWPKAARNGFATTPTPPMRAAGNQPEPAARTAAP